MFQPQVTDRSSTSPGEEPADDRPPATLAYYGGIRWKPPAGTADPKLRDAVRQTVDRLAGLLAALESAADLADGDEPNLPRRRDLRLAAERLASELDDVPALLIKAWIWEQAVDGDELEDEEESPDARLLRILDGAERLALDAYFIGGDHDVDFGPLDEMYSEICGASDRLTAASLVVKAVLLGLQHG